MYISKISIKNFRGIKNQELNFTRFNTLVGKNDCGKSTIINAIKLFLNDEKVSNKDFNFYSLEKKDIEIELTLFDYQNDLLESYLIDGIKKDGFDSLVQDFVIDDSLKVKKVWNYSEATVISSKIYLECNDFVENPI